jgi:hypothetical protein
MLLAFLARRAPDTHYTLGDWQRYFKLWRARQPVWPAPPSPSAAQLSPATTCGRKPAPTAMSPA